MKIMILLLFFASPLFSQNFGDVAILLHDSPADQRDMHFYKWYVHPKENNIYVKNFETTYTGFMMAFSEAEKLLTENDLELSNPIEDASKFHPEVDNEATFEEIHESISENKSKILRTWSVDGDYLSLLLQNDVYMLILGENTLE